MIFNLLLFLLLYITIGLEWIKRRKRTPGNKSKRVPCSLALSTKIKERNRRTTKPTVITERKRAHFILERDSWEEERNKKEESSWEGKVGLVMVEKLIGTVQLKGRIVILDSFLSPSPSLSPCSFSSSPPSLLMLLNPSAQESVSSVEDSSVLAVETVVFSGWTVKLPMPV